MPFHDSIDYGQAFQELPDWARQLESVAAGLFRWPQGYTPTQKPKVVHDPIFGTRPWDPWMVDLVDSYAVQRLRQVRQLSLANLTFPSAEHSRFPHSLGVLARVQQLSQEVDLEGPLRENACAAAILHDIGHGPFSHLSEDAYRHYEWFDGVVGARSSFFGAAAKPHEALGALLLLTKPARRFLEAINEAHRTDLDPRLIASFIVGRAAEDKAVVGMLVNGGLDGDKLDYLLRDAYMTGLGIGIDVDRWILSHRSQDPNNLRNPNLEPQLSSRLAEQVAFGKWTLRSAVYYHKKVRAADISYMQWAVAMADDAEARLGNVTINSPVDFLRLTDADVLSSHTPAIGTHEDRDGHPVVEVLRARLRDRDLPVLVEEYSKEELAEKGLHRVLFGADDRSTRSSVIKAIRHASEELAIECEAQTRYDVWLDVPETWTKDPTREYAGPAESEEDSGAGGAPSADVTERVGEIFDDEKYRARLFAHPSIRPAVLSKTGRLFDLLGRASSTQP